MAISCQIDLSSLLTIFKGGWEVNCAYLATFVCVVLFAVRWHMDPSECASVGSCCMFLDTVTRTTIK